VSEEIHLLTRRALCVGVLRNSKKRSGERGSQRGAGLQGLFKNSNGLRTFLWDFSLVW
jgi:hypothetical protein